MTINYTTLLGLAQPVTGTETGQWGDIVNNQITSLLEDSIAKSVTLNVTAANVTLTSNDGAANQARVATLIITGTPGTNRNIIAPSQSKIYQVINQSDSSVVIKGAATTGVTILAGASGVVAWNGSDFIEVGAIASNRTIKGTLQLSAGTVSAPSLTTTGDTNTGLYFPAADTVAIATGGVKRVEVDANGNVGVGVTPSAWGSSYKAIDIAPQSAVFGASGALYFSNNAYFNSSSQGIYKTTAAAQYMGVGPSGGFTWNLAPSGTAGNPITFTQAMTLDASGNLLIGATSAAQVLHVARGSGVSALSTFRANASTSGALYGQDSSNNAYCWNESDAVLLFGTNNTERARITSDGNLLVNRTSRLNNGKIEALASTSEQAFVAQVQTNTNSLFQGFNASGLSTFYVIGSGGIYSTSTTITAISDVSQKENIRPIEYGIAEVCALNPVKFDFKEGCGSEEKDLLGFVAQDVEPVIPELVKPFGDDGLKGLKTGDMIPVLVKAMQEQQALIEAQKTAIESLTARITALEVK